MRRLIPLALAAALAACATTPATHLTEGKALADAWVTFDSAVLALDAYGAAGKLTASEKATVAQDAAKVRDGLRAASAAYSADQDATAAQNVSAVSTFLSELVTIAAAHKGT